MWARAAGAAALILAVSVGAAADEAGADVQREIARCAAIEDLAGSTACYDSIADRLGIYRPSHASRQQTVNWDVGEETAWSLYAEPSANEDVTNIVLRVPAGNRVGDERKGGRPVLWIACRENNMDVYVDFGFFVSTHDPETVAIVDTRRPRHVPFRVSTDNQKVGLWMGGAANGFVRRLAGGRRLLVQVTSANGTRLAPEFDIRGLEDALTLFEQQCAWSLTPRAGESDAAYDDALRQDTD